MAKKKQAVVQPREMDKTIVIDNETYNINAVHSDKATTADFASSVEKVNYELVINEKGHDGDTVVSFDGSSKKSLDIVPASGGKFTGKITAPSILGSGEEIDEEAVLNFKDIVGTVLERAFNTNVLATWEDSKLTFNTTTGNINSSCLVKGLEEDLFDKTVEQESVLGFATINYNNSIANDKSLPWIPTYLYLCTDTGNIYLGTSTSPELIRLAVNSVNTKVAEAADSLTGVVDGEDVSYTVSTISDIINGATTVGVARNIRYEYVDPSTGNDETVDIDGSAVYEIINKVNNLSVPRADTATNALKFGNYSPDYYQKKITIANSADYPDGPTGGSNGDIMILY
jgi:hypothetical protein